MSGFLMLLGDRGDRLDYEERAWSHVNSPFTDPPRLIGTANLAAAQCGHPWQREFGIESEAMMSEDGLVIVGDSTLYGRQDLLAKLVRAGQTPTDDTANAWLVAAYRAWGVEMLDHIMGDFAFALWDESQRRLLAARDGLGGRPLYVARRGDSIGFSSSCRALALWRGTESSLNLTCLGAQVSGYLLSMGSESAYEGVEPLRPGCFLAGSPKNPTSGRFWSPPEAPSANPSSFEDATEELLDLLRIAVQDRLGPGTNTVWMSGGWDSTAIFGAGQDSLRRDGIPADRLRPVSISYPEGDPGNEDEFIQATADHWNVDVHWLKSDRIPLLADLEERAKGSEEPPPHLYELWNAELGKETRKCGSRVALDGCGGDNIFQVSSVVAADAIRKGRLPSAWKMLRSRRHLGWKYLVRQGLIPLVSPRLLQTLETVLRRRIPRHFAEQAGLGWMDPSFMSSHRIRERDLEAIQEAQVASPAQTENRLYVLLPAVSWASPRMRHVMLNEGVEVSSPLLDQRIIEFALKRPFAERASITETKILLRNSMKGLLPESVLAPRTHRTGVTSGFSSKRMNEAYPKLFERFLAEPMRLADLGILEPSKVKAAVQEWSAGRGDHHRVGLFNVLRVEFWLRGLEESSAT